MQRRIKNETASLKGGLAPWAGRSVAPIVMLTELADNTIKPRRINRRFKRTSDRDTHTGKGGWKVGWAVMTGLEDMWSLCLCVCGFCAHMHLCFILMCVCGRVFVCEAGGCCEPIRKGAVRWNGQRRCTLPHSPKYWHACAGLRPPQLGAAPALDRNKRRRLDDASAGGSPIDGSIKAFWAAQIWAESKGALILNFKHYRGE